MVDRWWVIASFSTSSRERVSSATSPHLFDLSLAATISGVFTVASADTLIVGALARQCIDIVQWATWRKRAYRTSRLSEWR